MSKTQLLYKSVIVIIVVISIQITYAGQTPSIPEGHDFTTVPADANYAPGQLLVRFAAKENGQQMNLIEKNEILSSLGGATIQHNFKLPGLTLVKLPTGQTVKDALKTFNGTNGILYAEPDYKITFESTFPNDPRFSEQWALHNTGQTGGTTDADIDAPESWDIHTGSSDVIVAVIDTGVDYNHPDLAVNIWINPGEDHEPFGVVGPEDFDGVDDDNNIYVDDIRGWNFNPNNNNPMDEYGHGTHIAGIIGSVGGNNKGVSGVCWNVKIMALNIATIPYTEEAFVSNAKKAIDYAVDKGAIVLNASWKIDAYSQSLKDTIAAADANGVLFVASAGNPKPSENPDNDENPRYPSSYDLDNIIAVMATDKNDERSLWLPDNISAYGATTVDLAAPGSSILSCDLNGTYSYRGGTSMAAAHVSGACALVWSVNPSLSHWDVKRIILETVDLIPELQNQTPCLSGGRLNVYNAVIEAGQLALTKIDDVNYGDLVLPDANIIYTINYGNPVTAPNNPIYVGTVNDVNIIDYLPEEANFIFASEPNMTYDSISHTVTWQIGTLSAGETDSVTLTVRVNGLAEPLGSITNVCVINGTGVRPTTATEITDVNCWSADVIYVDVNAPGSETGMSWNNAYTNLQKALERAADCYVPEIWVAKGTYKPTTNPTDHDANFALVEGVAIYGGFDGNETNLNQRNWLTNETIFTGDVNDDGIANDIGPVVAATNVTETASIDGFTITKARDYGGIRCRSASPTIRNNKIKDNYDPSYASYGYGVYCENNSSANIINCEIINNGPYGIYCDDSNLIINDCNINGSYNSNSGIYCNISSVIVTGCKIQNSKSYGIRSYQSNLTIANCIIKDNRGHGIYCGSATTIKNNWIHNNGISGTGSGIYFYSSSLGGLVRNNTIVDNDDYGIAGAGSPNISNCIFWYNRSGSLDWTGYTVTYSCVQGSPVYAGRGNINTNPGFFAADVNNYHLDPNLPSPCIDTGDPCFTDPNGTETDIDGEQRIFDGNYDGNDRVDIGADEFYWSPADFDGDKMVNSFDYAELAAVWLTVTLGEPDYNDRYDLQDNNFIDFKDHAVFADDWLWQAAWTQADPLQFMNAGIGQGMIESLDFTEGLETTVSTEQQQQAEQTVAEEPVAEPAVTEEPVYEPVDIEALIKWLDEIWLSGDLKESMTEDEYLEFRKAVEESGF